MISLETLIALIWIHTFADFVLQSDKMAITKSSSVKWLGIHVIVYTIPLVLFGALFALINGIAHFCTDYFTSKLTTYLYKKEKRHEFFIVVGVDQAIHLTTLVLTFSYFGAPLF